MQKVDIPLRLPGLNEYINECRTNKFGAAAMKRETEDSIGWFIKRLPAFERPVIVHFTWIEKDRKRDLDNIAFAKKFIFDALVKFGKLKGDGQKYVIGFTDHLEHGSATMVKIEIEETSAKG